MDEPATLFRDNPAASRFEIDVGGEIAFLEYRRRHELLWLVHTEVPDSLRGRGLGNALARGALDLARAQGWRVVAICPLVRAFLRKHPEYAPIVARNVKSE